MQVALESVNNGEKVTKPANPTRTGYTFVGWFEDGAESPFDFDNTPITADKTLQAKWQVITYNITYKLNGGENVEGNPTTYTIEDSIELKELTKGPTDKPYFVGWYLDEEFKNKVTSISTGNITVYAKWSDTRQFKVTFKNDNSIKVETVNEGGNIAKPDDPTKNGYTFAGWFEDGAESPFDFDNTTITADKALQAQWQVITYKIEYKNVKENSPDNPSEYTIESQTITLKDPVSGDENAEGSDFLGWYSDEDKKQAVSEIPAGSTGNKTFYAKWGAEATVECTVTFNFVGAEESAEDYTIKVVANDKISQSQIETAQTKIPEGYEFKGTYSDEGCTTEFDFTQPITADTTIYVKVEKKATEPTTPENPETPTEPDNKIVLTEDDEVVSSTTVTYTDDGKIKLMLEAANSGHGVRWKLKGTEGIDLSQYKIVINYTAKDAYPLCAALESEGSGNSMWNYNPTEVYGPNPSYPTLTAGDDNLELTADEGVAKVLFFKYNTWVPAGQTSRTDDAEITINSIEFVEK